MFFRKSFLIVTAFTICIATVSMSLNKKKAERSKAVEMVAQLYTTQMQQLDQFLIDYPHYFYDSSYAVRMSKYEELARKIKSMECLFYYYHPKLAFEKFFLAATRQQRDVGPPFPDSWIIAGPFGIGTNTEVTKMSKDDIAFSKMFIARAANNYRKWINESNYAKDCEAMSEADIFEALRLQMMRMSTIGISNADMTVEPAGMPGLEGEYMAWSQTVKIFLDQLPANSTLKKQMELKLQAGQKILDTKPAFRKFDRMNFLTEILIPLSTYLYDLRKPLNIESKTSFTPVSSNAKHLYEADVFNADYFAPGTEAFLTNQKAELGKFLFFDPILSDNNKRACASCHKPELAFTDAKKKAVKFDEFSDLPRNTPTVINAAFQKVQFWDLRASSLEDQLDSVINSPDELHSSFDRVIDRINSSNEYKKLFYAAFPETKQNGIERKHVKIAIACYERTLTALNARFDQYVRGDKSKMNDAEIHGFNLFMGQAKCATCHFAPLFSAPLPPHFEFTENRSLGVPIKDTMDVFQLDPDTGFSKVTKNPFSHFNFKVPTVRNAELTSPYMHNGVYKTLEQVMNFYNHAAGNKFQKDYGASMKGLSFFMVLPDSLDLNEQDKKDLVLFVKTLTDTTAVKNIPKRLPQLGEKYAALNNRKIGGEY
jgi:cytochrome c peroxidase